MHVELPDGRQFNAQEFAEQFPRAKTYDPATDMWTPAGEMSYTRINATLTLLPDGRVLAAGGEDPAGSECVLYSTTEIFDPFTNTWSPGPDLSGPPLLRGVGHLRGVLSSPLLSVVFVHVGGIFHGA